jgi:hypothetical protein
MLGIMKGSVRRRIEKVLGRPIVRPRRPRIGSHNPPDICFNYLAVSEDGRQAKIGCSGIPRTRFQVLDGEFIGKSHGHAIVLAVWKSIWPERVEEYFVNRFGDQRRSEWFRVTGALIAFSRRIKTLPLTDFGLCPHGRVYGCPYCEKRIGRPPTKDHKP